MTTQQIYQLAVSLGMKADLRGMAKVKKYLERTKAKYEKLTKEQEQEFDLEKLTNPYSDTRILVDNKKGQIKKILVGIDMEGAELLYADKIGADLVIAHHPAGMALADLHSVMDLQAQVLASYGVPINVAESLIKPRISEVSRSFASVNHNQAVDLAKLLKLDFICTHTVTDNLAASYLNNLLKRKKLEIVEDVLVLLKQIPEYQAAIKLKAGPTIFAGSTDSSCGKIVVTEFTGGTSGAKEIYEKMSQAGIGTIIGMHMKEEYRKEAEKHHLNVIIAGHMASDSLGMNLFLDQLEKKGIKIIPTSGLIRVRRFKIE